VSATEEIAFETLARAISIRAGFALEGYKPKCLKRRIAVRMRACGVHTYRDYATVLERTPAEVERLRDALTINVTRFYRNSETWDALRQRVLPALVEARQGHVRVWSAGCSSGEEPYTAAMVLTDQLERLGRASWAERITVDATDIDRESLARARAARYRAEAFAEAPADLVERYTEPCAEGRRVAERIRERVRVGELDLNAGRAPHPPYDVVVCRNVVIYFERSMQEKVFTLFVDALAPGGHLVLGKVETLFGAARERLQVVDARERIYRRVA
jgi:chemotaxis methyl-accepting protein methylase